MLDQNIYLIVSYLRVLIFSMEVTVLSLLPTIGGRVDIPTDPNNTIHSLINAFCNDKRE